MMVIRYSQPTLRQGEAGSRSADHTEAVPSQLYNGQDNKCCMARQFLLPSVSPLYTDTPDELRRPVTQNTHQIHYHLFHHAMGQKPWRGLSVGVPTKGRYSV